MPDILPRTPVQATRLLVVAYLAAVALGLVAGADFAGLFADLLPPAPAALAAAALVLALCGLVLLPPSRRAAGAALAFLLFCASYLTLFIHGEIAAFWRDLAVLCALLGASVLRETGAPAPRPRRKDAAEPAPVDPPLAAPRPAETERVALRRRVSVTRLREDLDFARTD